MATSSPIVLKWWMAGELGRLREAAGYSRQEVADHLRSSLATVRNAENGRNFPRPLELREMLTLYGVPERVDRFTELLTSAKKGRDWFEAFKGAAPDWFDLFLGLESSAGQIESYDALVIPGLFQTEAYAAAVIRADEAELSDAEVNRRVALRTARQEVLTRQPEPPTVMTVLDESVLYRAVEPVAMREQLEHLAKLADLPNVTVQVLPMGAGLHGGLNGTFIVLELTDLEASPALAYTDGLIQGSYYTAPHEVRRYRNTLTRLQIAAAKPRESLAMITERVRELS